MSKEKQIEEMAFELWELMPISLELSATVATDLYKAGYRKQSEWISVEERLPEEDGYYLVYTKYGYIEVERYKTWDDDDLDGGYWWEFEGLVTHWMPLPEAPKKGGAE